MPHAEKTPRSVAPAGAAPKGPPKKAFTAGAWEEARGLIWAHRKRLAFGLSLEPWRALSMACRVSAASIFGRKRASTRTRPKNSLGT